MKDNMNSIEVLSSLKHSDNKDRDKHQIINFSDIKDLLRPDMTIADVNVNNISLISRINKHLKNNYHLIEYISDLNESIKIREVLDKNNILVINSDFKSNGLKNSIVDLIIGKNIFGKKDNIQKSIKEINRVLNDNADFVLVELVSFEKPLLGFRSYFKKQEDHLFNNIVYNLENVMRKVKNCSYEIKIIGNGNFYFDNETKKSLQEFCDIYGYDSEDRNIILSNILLVVIQGKKK